MRVAAVMTDLMLYSRIDSAAIAAGATLIRIDTPSALPDDLDLVLVDWSTRQADWPMRCGRALRPASSFSASTRTSRPTRPRAQPDSVQCGHARSY